MWGRNWGQKLVHAQYDNEKRIERREFFDLNEFLRPRRDASFCYSIPSTDPLRCCIVKIGIYVMDLGLISRVGRSFSHHYIGMETECGVNFTIEKNTDCILLQSCGRPALGRHPIVWMKRDGVDRKHLDSLKNVTEDAMQLPHDANVLNIVEWINGRNEANEPYSLTESNCQHFAQSLWTYLTKKEYPNPSKFQPTFCK